MTICLGLSSIVTCGLRGVCTIRVRVTRLDTSRASNLTTGCKIGVVLGPFKATDVDRSRGQLADTEGGGSEPSVTLGMVREALSVGAAFDVLPIIILMKMLFKG
jgi:hypothetical protein